MAATLKKAPFWILKWLQNLFQWPLKHIKGHEDYLNRPSLLCFRTNTDFLMQNGGNLEKMVAILDF